ncbi:sensor histidine kinase [Flavobacterium seoulense]|uniref:histidine kinase n=1 Tax=Flavobacterium seoulense TaxID=1492738 RepID=A0A066WPE4_9FLAO|nr:HAMP domain-containing sensor histidine kinase [Flavobacterium seoulense]KDN54438.1 histidine kinase [Flavobacterium seoulense]
MQIRKKITITYIALSCFSTSLLCIVIFSLFKQNNEYYFIKRLQDRAKVASSAYSHKNNEKKDYYKKLKQGGLEELFEEKDFILKVNDQNTFEQNKELQLPPTFYSNVLKKGSGWIEEDYRYHYGQIFNETGEKYIVIVTAKDLRGSTSMIYILQILIFGGIGFIIVAYFFGQFLARRIIDPIALITKEVHRISASNLHNRLADTDGKDEISDLTKTFNDMLDRLETSFEIQANFTNNASHELKTPITTIIAETEIMLLKDREKSEYIHSLENINNQASKLGNLTESLLKLTQTGYDGRKQVLDFARMDEMLLEAKATIDTLFPDNRVNIKFKSIPEDESLLTIPCNRPLLELALNNIISNAVKYSNNDEVFVTLSVDQSKIKVDITDIGIGIPPEDIPFLYEPFFRGKIASKYNGYGLGLPLAMKIIRMHNGELQIQSETGKGTVVNITFEKKQ